MTVPLILPGPPGRLRCTALYHVRFEDLGSFASPLEQAGYAISYRHAGAAPLSEAEWRDTDLVVVLGGPVGVNDGALYPWLGGSLEGLRLRLALHKPTLGICLGAQLMAAALGADVAPRRDAHGAAAVEIGWSPLALADDGGPLAALRDVAVLHWHGDNIALPAAMSALAATPGTPCQAFAVGTHALGLQFHAEFEPAALEEWLTGHAIELARAGIELHQLRADTQRHGAALMQAARRVITQWIAGLPAPTSIEK